MVVGRALPLASAFRCSNCNLSFLRAFTSFAGVSIHPALNPEYTKPLSKQLARSRTLTISASYRSEPVQQTDLQPTDREGQEEFDAEPIAEEKIQTKSVTLVPWYLQVNAPQKALGPLSERQRLPELPPDPPPLLQVMLKHISISLGLDDLLIYDLRKMDPPPTLGTNLLMVIGTARSEKHLHVSADRFCRWLRTDHKLSPYADGLLGRGELKLKMRRKTRRARLLSSVGSSESGSVDDGMRTGWVCVNVGTVEDGGIKSEEIKEPEGFVGFGSRVSGANVIIQMLTEEKREELDLEGLWGGMEARQERRKARRLKGLEDDVPEEDDGPREDISVDLEAHDGEHEQIDQEVGRNCSPMDVIGSDLLPIAPRSLLNMRSTIQIQVRGFHSLSKRFASKVDSHASHEHKRLDASSVEPGILTLAEMPHKSSANVPSRTHSEQHEDLPSQFEDTANLLSLQALVKRLKALTREDGIEALGSGVEDFSSTSFLASFYQSFPIFPSAEHWECRVSVVCHAIQLRHKSYTKEHLKQLYDKMQASAVHVPAGVCVTVFKTLLLNDAPSAHASAGFNIRRSSFEGALEVLEDMHLRGYSVLTEDIYTTLLVGVILDRKLRCKFDQLMRLIEQQSLGFIRTIVNVNSHERILHALADVRLWRPFWVHWSGIARCMQPRPKALYLLMFHRIAQRNDQAACMRHLRTKIPEMERERPAVPLDKDVAKVIMECLRVADPSVASRFKEDPDGHGEWAKLWKRCEAAIQDPTICSHRETPA